MELIKKYFKNVETLYDYQKHVLDKITDGKNTLAVIPTGGGKSLIFQIGALMLQGTAIVVSPLKALMQEQVNDLQDKGINAICINGDMDFQTQRKILRQLGTSKPKLIYISPERLNNYFFRAAIKAMGVEISMVVIDEAHCISQWGFDFRPDYNKIKPFINYLESIGSTAILLAVTATISSEPRADIAREFNIKDEDILIEKGVIRDNLELEFMKVERDEQKIRKIKEFISNKGLKKVLVYTYSREKCEELAKGFENSVFFHANLSSEDKLDVYNKFKNGTVRVLFATTAFGMGMNIPDIDGVIHYQLPESIEEYYQHVGRGARDKKICQKCSCLFLWSDRNFQVKANRIESEALTITDIEEGFDWINPKRKITIKEMNSEELMRNDGSYGSINLRLLIPTFERYKILEVIGEVNGKPRSIVFKNETDFWRKAISSLQGIKNTYTTIEKKSGILIQDLINHVYQQELLGNIIKIPATEKLIFIKLNYEEMPKEKKDRIIRESESIVKCKLKALAMLRELCEIENKEAFIASQLQVPYSG